MFNKLTSGLYEHPPYTRLSVLLYLNMSICKLAIYDMGTEMNQNLEDMFRIISKHHLNFFRFFISSHSQSCHTSSEQLNCVCPQGSFTRRRRGKVRNHYTSLKSRPISPSGVFLKPSSPNFRRDSNPRPWNTKGGSITVPLTSCFDLFGLACFANKTKNCQLSYS